jgi:hypothetical protein
MANRSSHSILVANLRPEHKPNCLLVPERNVIALSDEIKSCISDEFKAWMAKKGALIFKVSTKHSFITPVKHSTNLKPSTWAIASIILELTVEATMASLSL